MMAGEKHKALWARLRYGVTNYDEEIVVKATRELVETGADVYEAIIYGLLPGIEEVGRLYEQHDYGVAEMIMCADTLNSGLHILRPHLKGRKHKMKGQIIIGVVQGDIHDIGKNIVKMMFDAAGFEVHDLGRDVPLERFVAEHFKTNSEIVALSAMMTTTTVAMKEVINTLKAKNPNVRILVGGAPVTEQFADEAGADGYARDANTALKAAINMIEYLSREILH